MRGLLHVPLLPNAAPPGAGPQSPEKHGRYLVVRNCRTHHNSVPASTKAPIGRPLPAGDRHDSRAGAVGPIPALEDVPARSGAANSMPVEVGNGEEEGGLFRAVGWTTEQAVAEAEAEASGPAASPAAERPNFVHTQSDDFPRTASAKAAAVAAASAAAAADAEDELAAAAEEEEERRLLEACFRASISYPRHTRPAPVEPIRYVWRAHRPLTAALQQSWAAPSAAAFAVAFAFSAVLSASPQPSADAASVAAKAAISTTAAGVAAPALAPSDVRRLTACLRTDGGDQIYGAVSETKNAVRCGSGSCCDEGVLTVELAEQAAQPADPLLYLPWQHTELARPEAWQTWVAKNSDAAAASTFTALAVAAASGSPSAGLWILVAGCAAVGLFHGAAAAQIASRGQVVLAALYAVNCAVATVIAVTVARAERLMRQLFAAAGFALATTGAAAAAAACTGDSEEQAAAVAVGQRVALAGAALLLASACVELSLLQLRWRAARLATSCQAALDARWQRAAAGSEAWTTAAAATEALARELGARVSEAGDMALRQEADCAEQLAVQAEAVDMLLRRKVCCWAAWPVWQD
jgi:hypothetical protein